MLTGNVPTGGGRGGGYNLTSELCFAGMPSTRRSTEMGIFCIMSIIYTSCVSSAYNQKPTGAYTHTECDLHIESLSFKLDQQLPLLASGKHLLSQELYVCLCLTPTCFLMCGCSIESVFFFFQFYCSKI